nr:hypothetical protein [Tanacetum cinerariifolium]
IAGNIKGEWSGTLTVASITITAVEAQVPVATLTATPSRVTNALSRRRKGVAIRDPSNTSIIILAKTKSKDKSKTKEQIGEEESKALKKINETPAEKSAKRLKLDEVPVVDYEIYNENNKPYYKIQRAASSHQLYLSFLSLLRNFNKEDLEALWRLIITFTTTQLILLVVRKYPLTKFTLNQMLNNVLLEVEEESEVSLELLSQVKTTKLRQLRQSAAADTRLKKMTKIDENIINEYYYKFIQVGFANMIHEIYEYGRCIVPTFSMELIYKGLGLLVPLLESNRFGILFDDLEKGRVGSDDGVTTSLQLSQNSRPPMLDHQDKYMMKAQVHVTKSSAIFDVQPLPRRKHYCQIYHVVKHMLRERLLASFQDREHEGGDTRSQGGIKVARSITEIGESNQLLIGLVARSVPKDRTRSVPKEPSRSVLNELTISVPKEPSRSVPKEPSRSVSKEPSRSVPEEPTKSVPEEPTRSVPNEPSRSVLKEPI